MAGHPPCTHRKPLALPQLSTTAVLPYETLDVATDLARVSPHTNINSRLGWGHVLDQPSRPGAHAFLCWPLESNEMQHNTRHCGERAFAMAQRCTLGLQTVTDKYRFPNGSINSGTLGGSHLV